MAEDEKTTKASKVKSIEKHAETLGTPDWQFAGVKTLRNWPEGKEVPESEYKQAITELMNTEIR